MNNQSDPTKADLASDNWKERSATKRSRKRPFILEWRYIGNSAWMQKRWGTWVKWSAYETKKQRDAALEQKQKSNGWHKSWEYRAVDL